MSEQTAFIGDVHGNIEALRGLLEAVSPLAQHLVFLGDYINKGAHSAEVLGELLPLQRSGAATLLRGNHETAMLEALDSSDLSAFLKMGGAATIRSYVSGPVGPDVSAAWRRAIPQDHIAALRQMAATYETADLVAAHTESDATGGRFSVSAHVSVGELPLIDAHYAHVDTGCGTPSGRLTAFLWPSRAYVQVDEVGAVVHH